MRKIVCIGDSLTFGFGVPKQHRWTELVKSNLKINLINKGVNGDTTTGMLSRSYIDVIENNPSHVLIMGGTNDFFMNHPVNYVYENIIELTNEAISFNIKPLIGIQPLTDPIIAKTSWSSYIDFEEVNENISLYRSLIIKYCLNNNIKYIDFFNDFNKVVSENSNTNLYIDGIHPTVKGHKLMYSSFDFMS